MLAAIVTLAVVCWVVVVQQGTGTPELDANTAQQSLVVLDDLFAIDSTSDR